MTSLPMRPMLPMRPGSNAPPSKLFFRIGEVAGLVGVEPHVLRYWEREFRSIRPTKSAKGQRVYSRKDVENLVRVRDLLYRDGFTIAGAKKRLKGGGDERGTALEDSLLKEGRESEADRATDEVEPLTVDVQVDSQVDSESASDVELDVQSTRDERQSPPDPPLYQKLTALRAEVEAFLGELEIEGPRTTKRSDHD